MNWGQALRTISAIPVTPFDRLTKEIDWAGVEANVEFLIHSGIKVVVACGNTSEFYALTLKEAKAVTERVVQVAAGRALVIAGVGYNVETAIELGRHALKVGADAVLIHQPVHPYVTDDGLESYYETVMEGIGAPSLVYFKDPAISDDVLVRISSRSELVGVKYAVNDLPRFASLVGRVPASNEVAWICGTAEKWAPFFFHAGAVGFTSGLVNVSPRLSLAMLFALQNNQMETVWKIWSQVVPFENLRAKHANGYNVLVVKEAMNLLGLHGGATRPPVGELAEGDALVLSNILKGWSVL
ncbi:dihydrodipicolinate synthase [Alicyclobacillus ferrooxydans]|uniref:Dihydrodipicolinate synthase n=1 Tax=Alicyclobacillus ferrooxydans TaxID=471514 RepID=A0A0P9EEZ4_9BACL|nr:dihydrodipicolinate synthase [Alicyclobacillus ferrooxydans]